MKLFLSILVLSATLLALNSCGGSGGSSSSSGGTVDYCAEDCEATPICRNTSSIKQDLSGKTKYMTCVWWGATYEDRIDAHVTVNFSKPGAGCWQVDGVVVTGGSVVESTSGG